MFVKAIFAVNVILVIDNERMQKELLEHLEKENLSKDLQVVVVESSRGVELDSSLEEKTFVRDCRLKRQIYGHPLKGKQELYVHEIDFKDIVLCNLGGELTVRHMQYFFRK